VSHWGFLPGETAIDVSGLKRKGINTRAELNRAEAENIRKAVVKYHAAKPSRRSAPFTLSWAKRLHKQMFGLHSGSRERAGVGCCSASCRRCEMLLHCTERLSNRVASGATSASDRRLAH
jgi:hypothetical protein